MKAPVVIIEEAKPVNEEVWAAVEAMSKQCANVHIVTAPTSCYTPPGPPQPHSRGSHV